MTHISLTERAGAAVRKFHELIDLGLINTTGEFVSPMHYPPIGKFLPMDEDALFSGYTRPKDEPFTLYAHIPFCSSKCSFCHVPNIITRSESEKDLYLENIAEEMDLWLQKLGVNKFRAASILIGGGTPTYLTPAQLERFLKAFTSRVEMSPSVQFSCDIDPLTVIGYEGRERLKVLKAFNVTRLSMGAQSFSDGILKSMNLHHNAADTVRAIGQVAEMGFKQELEFIYGYPGDTAEQWVKTLEQALGYGLAEIMIYRLKIIAHTARAGAVTGQLEKRDNRLIAEEAIRFKAIGYELLEKAGYNETIERSFSRDPGWFSNYRNDFMGRQMDNLSFGFWALSRFRDRAFQNPRGQDLKEYYQAIKENKLPVRFGWIETRDQQLRRNILLPLENRDLLKQQFQDRLGVAAQEVFGRKITLLKEHGLLEEDAEYLRPTKTGRFFIDEITQSFYHPDFLPFPRDKYKDGPLNPYLDNETLS